MNRVDVLPEIGFLDLRHFFASECVMAGLDFMTIAAWLGHSDSGILAGKVYGHLADTHKKAAAQKLSFFQVTAALARGNTTEICGCHSPVLRGGGNRVFRRMQTTTDERGQSETCVQYCLQNDI